MLAAMRAFLGGGSGFERAFPAATYPLFGAGESPQPTYFKEVNMAEFYREVQGERALVYYTVLDSGLPATREHEAEPADVRFELLHPHSRKLLGLELSAEEVESIEEDCLINWRRGHG